jgi:hypothetical protein
VVLFTAPRDHYIVGVREEALVMPIASRAIGGKVDQKVLLLTGAVDGRLLGSLRASLEDHNVRGVRRFLVDLVGAKVVAAGEVAVALGSAGRWLAGKGGALVVVGAPDAVRREVDATGFGKLVAFAPSGQEGLALLGSFSPELPKPEGPPVSFIDRSGPIPLERLRGWDEGAVEVARVELPSGELLICDPRNTDALPATTATRPIQARAGSHPVLAREDARGSLAFVAVRVAPGRATSFERLGWFDSHSSLVCFQDKSAFPLFAGDDRHLESLVLGFERWLEGVDRGGPRWWKHVLALEGRMNAVSFARAEEPDALSVYAGRDESGALVSVVVDLHRSPTKDG